MNLDGNLSDRLDNMNGLVETGDRRQPLRLTTNDPTTLLAAIGQNGRIGRNTFRAGNVLELDLSLSKSFFTAGSRRLILRAVLRFSSTAQTLVFRCAGLALQTSDKQPTPSLPGGGFSLLRSIRSEISKLSAQSLCPLCLGG